MAIELTPKSVRQCDSFNFYFEDDPVKEVENFQIWFKHDGFPKSPDCAVYNFDDEEPMSWQLVEFLKQQYRIVVFENDDGKPEHHWVCRLN